MNEARSKETVVLKMNSRDPDLTQIRDVARAVREGKIVAFPTETVYGIGGPMNVPGIQTTVAMIKYRDPAKPLTFHIADLNMLEMLDVPMTAKLRFFAKNFWPGPVTALVLNRQGNKVGIRFPKSAVCSMLIHAAGVPFVGTSANRSGEPSPITAEDVLKQLSGQIDIVLDAGTCVVGKDSSIVDLTQEPPQIVRQGALLEEVRDVVDLIAAERYPRKKILIVCTGNSCRSPMAEGWLKLELYRNRLEEKIEVDSCGVGAREGAPPTMEAILSMRNREVDISSHRSRSCTREDVMTSDLIFAMSEEHAFFIQNMVPSAKNKIRVLNIPDPIGMGIMVYDQVIATVEKKLKACWDEIIS